MKCEECSRGTATCSCNKCETVYCSACFERVIHAFKCGDATSHGLMKVKNKYLNHFNCQSIHTYIIYLVKQVGELARH